MKSMHPGVDRIAELVARSASGAPKPGMKREMKKKKKRLSFGKNK